MDFALPKGKLNVEIDGSSHRLAARKASDARRDELLVRLGWKILRVSAADVKADIEDVRDRIAQWQQSLTGV